MSESAPLELAANGPLPTERHELNELAFELPAALKDKTVHVFALTDDGPSEFNLVISRAKAITDESLEEFADRLCGELGRALPKFRLKQRLSVSIDHCPAIELQYGWSNNGVVMQQRQTVTLIQAAHGAEPEVLMVAGTCANSFAPNWHAAYDEMLVSMKLRRPWTPVASSSEDDANPTEPVAQARRHGFALMRDGTLHVTPSVAELANVVQAHPAALRTLRFYRHDGDPLQAHAPVAGSDDAEGSSPALTFVSALRASGLGPLQHRLATVERVVGELHDLPAVKAYLEHWKAAEMRSPAVEGPPIA